jgi:hypothetical protein
MSDADLLAVARADGRALVTENVQDFRQLEIATLESGGHHAGLVYTTHRQFPRTNPGTLGRLVLALDALLAAESELRDRSLFLVPR